jgi:hypothetical protein
VRTRLLDRPGDDEVNAILTHPQHQHALRNLIVLIRELHDCHTPEDFYHFQHQLRGLVIEIEKRRSAISRQIKRLDSRLKISADAPALGTNLDPSDRDAWVFESDVYERVWRQLKTLADALAWKAFSYERRIVIALSRAEAPGPMYGKAGLEKELEIIEAAWRDDQKFVLHHDLTNVIRVGDLTIFDHDGMAWLHEAKTNERRRISAQEQKLAATSHVLADQAGALPSGHTPMTTTIDYRTDLKGLRQVLDLAHSRTGLAGARVSSGRGIVAISQFTAPEHFTSEEFGTQFAVELARVRRRVGADKSGHTLTMHSIDRAGLELVRPPWAIYPITAETAASLITDGMSFIVCMNPDAIIDALARVGVEARWMQRLDGTENPTMPLLEVSMRTSGRLGWTSLNLAAITDLMLEMIDLKTWSRQVAAMLSDRVEPGIQPWPCFTREAKVWA